MRQRQEVASIGKKFYEHELYSGPILYSAYLNQYLVSLFKGNPNLANTTLRYALRVAVRSPLLVQHPFCNFQGGSCSSDVALTC